MIRAITPGLLESADQGDHCGGLRYTRVELRRRMISDCVAASCTLEAHCEGHPRIYHEPNPYRSVSFGVVGYKCHPPYVSISVASERLFHYDFEGEDLN